MRVLELEVPGTLYPFLDVLVLWLGFAERDISPGGRRIFLARRIESFLIDHSFITERLFQRVIS
jgi:hypothetical protein